MAALGLVALFAGLLLALRSVARHRSYVSTNLAHAQEELLTSSTSDPELEELKSSLAEVEGVSSALGEMDSLVATQDINWPEVVNALTDYDSTELALQSVVQEELQITLTGCAVNDAAVVSYAQRLESSQQFSSVQVQSINAMSGPCASLGALQTSVPANTTPTLGITVLPTASYPDDYEPDQEVAPSIYLDQPQIHTFWPSFDVDRVNFLAKAGRYYLITTSALSAGVDTLLTVHVGDLIYDNDDREAGDLSSEILLSPAYDYDVTAVIEVSNRGEYGSSQAYTLTVQEIVPTPTATSSATAVSTTTASPTGTPTLPTATSTPTPMSTLTPTPTPTRGATSTSTLSPTATQAPSVTPTPTFDLGDSQEPDDYTPRDIIIGPTYSYNFYPDYDIDRARFTTQAGVRYRVYTSGLAMDVDTQISIQVGGTIYANDNVADGDLSSSVVIEGNGGQALILVLNRGRYGAAQWYKLTVEELPAEATSTPAETASPLPTSEALSRQMYPSASLTPRPTDGVMAVAGRGPGLASKARAKTTPTATVLLLGPGAQSSVEFTILLQVEAAAE